MEHVWLCTCSPFLNSAPAIFLKKRQWTHASAHASQRRRLCWQKQFSPLAFVLLESWPPATEAIGASGGRRRSEWAGHRRMDEDGSCTPFARLLPSSTSGDLPILPRLLPFSHVCTRYAATLLLTLGRRGSPLFAYNPPPNPTWSCLFVGNGNHAK
jgi:hypothetical protein